jgi:hypothetical protein
LYLYLRSSIFELPEIIGGQFDREYKRFFGLPPMRDVARLRVAARESVG